MGRGWFQDKLFIIMFTIFTPLQNQVDLAVSDLDVAIQLSGGYGKLLSWHTPNGG